ncbi:MAG: outer membrane beta-barrel protein [Bacteroidales bacterium]
MARLFRGIMTRITLLILLLAAGLWLNVQAQSYSLRGSLYDDQLNPLVAGTVVLLNPADSTLEFFGVSNMQGQFRIMNIKAGNYLVQASFIGFSPLYSPVTIPRVEGDDLGDIILSPLPVDLEGAEIVGEAVPLAIDGDTIVYHAAAFKTGPDAATEDLLKKLPGIEVDRAGNIKALGEDVKQLYVDGKEFFGSDPRIATRNIPADAIDRVQVYDKRSDETEFSGVDDGTRDKTMNLELKEERKKGVFGNLLGGYGSGNHYKASAKAYHFTDKVQMAGLGMINNVNEYGFSFGDYLDFSGGVNAMMGGGGSAQIRIETDNSFPVNFGQPVNGLTTSGAGGLNFSYSTNRHNRTFISYLVNGSDKSVEESVRSKQYINEDNYTTLKERSEQMDDLAHRINFGIRRRIDSLQNLIIEGNASLMFNRMSSYTETSNSLGDDLINQLFSDRGQESDRVNGDLNASYQRMLGRNKSTLKFSTTVSAGKSLENIRISNEQAFAGTPGTSFYRQFQDNRTDRLNVTVAGSFTRRLGKGWYLSPRIAMGEGRERLDRLQGPLASGTEPTDSLSPSFSKIYRWARPALNLKYNTQKSQLTMGLISEMGQMETVLNELPYPESDLFHVTPMLSWDYSRMSGRKISLTYSSAILTPAVPQLLPVVNNLNPLNIYYGNPGLTPEYSHRIMAHWLIFDQFSFTSLMMALNGSFTRDKINWVTSVNEELVQVSTLTNVDWDYRGGLNLDFSTPIRKLGLKANLDIEENWNRGLSIINGEENIYNTFTQRYALSADNRKKETWDVASGIGFVLTHTRYDIQESLDNRYFDLSWFADIAFTPSERWNASLTADITGYSEWGAEKALLIPLLRAEVSYYFLAQNRAALTLSVHDLLNKNQNVNRLSELNYMRETRSNTIGRYVMLLFRYRLNKFARKGGLEVDVHRR